MEIITRRIDKLGRIVLPMDYRKALGLDYDAEVVLGIEGDTITVRGKSTACKLCGSVIDTSHIGICSDCIRKIKSI